MPRKLPAEINQKILKALELQPDGLRIEALQECMEGLISRRSLQRRLAELDKDGAIQKIGEGKGTRYRLPAVQGVASIVLQPVSVEVAGEVYIPISPEGKEVRNFVRKPLGACLT